MAQGLPDGEGVFSRKAAPAGKVIAHYVAVVVPTVLATVWVLSVLGMLSGEAHASSGVSQAKMVELVAKVDEVSADLKEMKTFAGQVQRDVAVIKRQLGLDGLGPPPMIPMRAASPVAPR